MSIVRIINVSVQLWGSVLTLVIITCLLFANHIKNRLDRIYIEMLFMNMFTMLCDAAALYFRGRMGAVNSFFVRFTNFCGFFFGASLAFICGSFIKEYLEMKLGRKLGPKYSFVYRAVYGIEILMLLINLFYPFLYRIGADNLYVRLPGYSLIFLTAFTNSGMIALSLMKFHKQLAPWERYILLVQAIIPFASILLTIATYGIVYGHIGSTTCLIILFIYLQAEYGRKMAEQENLLLQNKISMTVAQIQPHFMFNALNTIQYLCEEKNPDSGEVVNHFSRFLRENMESVFEKEPVSLERELEHLKNYLAIEMYRFPEIEIKYELESRDFRLPALTLQPLVENAIKHGLRYKKENAVVEIKTWEKEGNYFLLVSDNGVGFDPEKLREQKAPEGGRSHVGLQNTIERVRMISGGEVHIESKIGEGCRVIVRIPKDSQEKEVR